MAPQRSIILLEDVDAAFVSRDDTQAVKTAYEGLSRVTFSGLLNTLDGVASSEARVVFMTTNYLERYSLFLYLITCFSSRFSPLPLPLSIPYFLLSSPLLIFSPSFPLPLFPLLLPSLSPPPLRLDPALIRPGRVDMKVLIDYASKHQLEQMFQRFYPKLSLGKSRYFAELVLERGKNVSMAQIQGYFMFYKSEPEEVMNNIDKIWT